MTIRQLFQLFEKESPEHLDAELNIAVWSRGKRIAATMPRDLWGFPRSSAIASTGEPARITMDVMLDDSYQIVHRRK